jgi:hypothetical protein
MMDEFHITSDSKFPSNPLKRANYVVMYTAGKGTCLGIVLRIVLGQSSLSLYQK